MPKKIFKTDFASAPQSIDPESLFRDLRGRAPEIQHLWSHQADLLRAYYPSHINEPNVALELPTGAGKTLIGLLIAEYRRVAFGERTVYVCPTRQLARQVGLQSKKYGLRANVFTGSQKDYPPGEFGDFQAAQTIGITTYSGIFNSNPRISDAQAFILDDAHAAENFIGKMWSLEILRSDVLLYKALVALFRDALPGAFASDLLDAENTDAAPTPLVDLIPGAEVRKCTSTLRDLLEQHLEETDKRRYAWSNIKNHLHACGVYVSFRSLLIRPLIPPTSTHQPFMRAKQRIYMSATLGAGGELERVTGIGNIKKIPVPAGWDKQGTGRRLFLFPNTSLSRDETQCLLVSAFKPPRRILILTPSEAEARIIRSALNEASVPTLSADDIEASLDAFTSKQHAALLLSRYDGLDLPHDTCRFIVISGLPAGTNLQEKFIASRIAASSLLRDRVLTRFAQGVGRCTRSDNDFAAVIIVGQELTDFILKRENRSQLHAELQAELQFGIENSKNKTIPELMALWTAFLEQGDNWREAEQAIVRCRDTLTRMKDPAAEKLSEITAAELNYSAAVWAEDYDNAIQHARSVVDSLSGNDLGGYRGFWNYLAADAALCLYEQNNDSNLLVVARTAMGRAAKDCPAVSWLSRISHFAEGHYEPSRNERDTVLSQAVENIQEKLCHWGFNGRRFDDEITTALKNIQAIDHKQFHQGLSVLGEMLGFRTRIAKGTADPDCIWFIGNTLFITHEAKSEQNSDGEIGVRDTQQAQGHVNWVKSNLRPAQDASILPLVESPRNFILDAARPHASSLAHVRPERLVAFFHEIANVLRRIRSQSSSTNGEAVLDAIYRELTGAKLRPSDVLEALGQNLVNKMAAQTSSQRISDVQQKKR